MKRILVACSVACLSLVAQPASASSIGTYSGCKRSFSGSTLQACLDCVGGGNFYQGTSRTCGLAPGMKPSRPAGESGSGSGGASTANPSARAPLRSGSASPVGVAPVVTVPPVALTPPVPVPPLPAAGDVAPASPVSSSSSSRDDTRVATKDSSMCSTSGAGTSGGLASFGLVGVAAALACIRRRARSARA